MADTVSLDEVLGRTVLDPRTDYIPDPVELGIDSSLIADYLLLDISYASESSGTSHDLHQNTQLLGLDLAAIRGNVTVYLPLLANTVAGTIYRIKNESTVTDYSITIKAHTDEPTVTIEGVTSFVYTAVLTAVLLYNNGTSWFCLNTQNAV